MNSEERSFPQGAGAGVFATTHWTVVLAAGEGPSSRSEAALAKLCETYWFPLYAYARRQGNSVEDAEDLTQQFFARFLGKNYIEKADRERGKFRTFLLGSMKNFLVNEWKHSARLKRGGGHSFIPFDLDIAEGRYAADPMAAADAEIVYDKQWAIALIEQVFTELRCEYAKLGREGLVDELKPFIWGDETISSYAAIGHKLGMAEGTIKVAMHRLRQRFREMLRAEVAETVSRPEEIDGELRHLIAVLG